MCVVVEKWVRSDRVECGMIITIKLQQQHVEGNEEAGWDAEAAAAAVGAGEHLQPAAAGSSKGPVQRYHLAQQDAIVRRLRLIPHAHLVRLQENKNELTFIWVRPASTISSSPATDATTLPLQGEQPREEVEAAEARVHTTATTMT